MIRLAALPDSLTDAERYALSLLIDLARLLPLEDGAGGDVVRLSVTETDRVGTSLGRCLARGWHLERTEGEVRVPRGLLRLLTDVAAGAAEQRSGVRDRFGRVPSSENALVAEGLEREPLVSRAGAALRQAVRDVAGRRPVRLLAPWPEGRRWAAAFSHDLDVVDKWPAFTALRLAELARKRELARAARVVRSALGATFSQPTWDGVAQVLAVEREHSIRSTWFILCGTPTLDTIRAGDLTYVPESAAVRRILKAVDEGGHELGLHGSFETVDRPGVFPLQRRRLEGIVRRPVRGVRQHYLRLRPGRTERDMAEAGFLYDSTHGFADRNGFRLGVADVLGRWDATGDQPLGIDEAPFVWMDRSLSKYRGVEDPTAWIDDALSLADVCREVEGLWVGVWHPNLTPPLGFPGAPDAFGRLARGISEREPYVATLGAIVSWRRARRAARAEGIAPDGGVVARTDEALPARLHLEDSRGRPREPVACVG